MSAPYFHLLGHIFLASDACERNSSLASAMEKAGFGKDKIAQGMKLAKNGEQLIARKGEAVGEDRIYEHNLHKAASEVEMWRSTASFRLKKAIDDQALIKKTMGKDIHAHDHTVTIVAQSLRTIAMIRAEAKLHEPLSEGGSVEDLIIRGWVLLNKVYRNGQVLMAPGAAGDPDNAIFEEIAEQQAAMLAWIAELGQAAEKLKGQPALIGELGYVPAGVGLPLGGTSYAVPLHEKAQRADLPDMDDLRPDPGWSAGRQGRNRENLGKGWVKPSFE
jgi:hypothetical protein